MRYLVHNVAKSRCLWESVFEVIPHPLGVIRVALGILMVYMKHLEIVNQVLELIEREHEGHSGNIANQ